MAVSQFIVVVIVLALALTYVARRSWSRLSSLIRQKQAASSCASKCGGCGTSQSR